MKILLGIDNSYLKEKLDEIYGEAMYPYDICLMENVIEILSKTEEKYIVITKDTLTGNLSDQLYAKQLRIANPNCIIIYIVKELTNSYKEFLLANEIFNILEENKLTINTIVECIENPKGIIYKEAINDNMTNEIQDVKEQYTIKNQIISKETIGIFGTSGAGKSFASSVIAKELATTLQIDTALLDMDIQNSAIALLNNIEGNKDMLNTIVEDVDKYGQINSKIDKYMIKDDKKKVWYLTNNCSIFDCQNKLSTKYYEKIYQAIKNKYDYTMIDLPASPFLDVVHYTLKQSTKIIFVLNPNYISIRQALKYLDLLTQVWDIPKQKIGILINKMDKLSLDVVQLKSIFKEYSILGIITYQSEIEGYINGIKQNLQPNFEILQLYQFLEIKSSQESVITGSKKKKKINILEKLRMVSNDS